MFASNKLPRGIYGITDPKLLPGERLFSGVESALKGGCKVIQYRNKSADYDVQVVEAQALSKLCRAFQARLIINDNLALALEVDADGVHLGKSDGSIRQARLALGEEKILGVTCHSDNEYAQTCIKEGVDYCAFGRFFPSLTKPDAPSCSLEILSEIARLPCSTVAIGGITMDNMDQLMDTPLHNIAVIHSLFGQEDIETAARRLSEKYLRLC